MESLQQLSCANDGLAYFYCDRNQSERRDPELILTSFVRQLSTFQSSDSEIPKSIIQVYNSKKETAFASGKLKVEESQAILAELCKMYDQVSLVLDALDECDIITRSNLIDILDKLINKSPKPVKVFMSSRRDRDIKNRFENGLNLEVRATDNQKDIEKFVRDKVFNSPVHWQEDLSYELKEHICDSLVMKSGGV